jgi:hypothetical protein
MWILYRLLNSPMNLDIAHGYRELTMMIDNVTETAHQAPQSRNTTGSADIPIPIQHAEDVVNLLETSDDASIVTAATSRRSAIVATFPSTNATYVQTQPANASSGERKCAAICATVINSQHVPVYNYRDRKFYNSDTRAALELDIFYPSIRFGIEYNGRQHYTNSSHFNSIAINQSARDNQKRAKTHEHGITVVSIPYTYDDDQIEKAIKDAYESHMQQ